MDISSIKAKSLGRAKFWLLVVDECTKMMWSFFLKQKSNAASVMIPFLKDLETKHGKKVRYIYCDNADENKVVDEESKNDRLGIKFEYAAPGTPQQNGMVERAFMTLYG